MESGLSSEADFDKGVFGIDAGGLDETAMTEKEDSSPKMNTVQAYFGLIKAYCAINVLLLPKSFKNGGWLLSPISLIVACIFEATCAIKLAQCGLFTGTISYQHIVLTALGPSFHKVFMIIIAVVQFQFTISQLAFIVESINSTI